MHLDRSGMGYEIVEEAIHVRGVQAGRGRVSARISTASNSITVATLTSGTIAPASIASSSTR